MRLTKNGIWCHGHSRECFDCDDYNTRKNAIDGGKELYVNEFYIGEVQEISFNKDEVYGMSEDVINQMIENLVENAGEFGDDFEVSKEDEKVLQEKLEKAFEEWIKECKIKPNCFSVTNVECIGTEEQEND